MRVHSLADREVVQQTELLRRENRVLLARLRAFVDTYYPAKAEEAPAPTKVRLPATCFFCSVPSPLTG